MAVWVLRLVFRSPHFSGRQIQHENGRKKARDLKSYYFVWKWFSSGYIAEWLMFLARNIYISYGGKKINDFRQKPAIYEIELSHGKNHLGSTGKLTEGNSPRLTMMIESCCHFTWHFDWLSHTVHCSQRFSCWGRVHGWQLSVCSFACLIETILNQHNVYGKSTELQTFLSVLKVLPMHNWFWSIWNAKGATFKLFA